MVWIEVNAWKSTRKHYDTVVKARAAAMKILDHDDGAYPNIVFLYPNKDCKGNEAIGFVLRHWKGNITWHPKTKNGNVSYRLYKNGKIKR